MLFYLLFVLIAVIFIALIFFKSKKSIDLKGKHVFITGGTKGIGYSLGLLAVESGANVSVIARDVNLLDKTKMDLLHCFTHGTSH